MTNVIRRSMIRVEREVWKRRAKSVMERIRADSRLE
jgi:hypothetical protein